jgi:Na+/phosphate symporter
MIKADDKVKYEDSLEAEFTNFEELKTRVEILQENFDEVVEILRSNDLVRNKKIEAPYFNEDEVYGRLEQK